MKVSSDQKSVLEECVLTGIYSGFFEGIKKTGLGGSPLRGDFPIKGSKVAEVATRHTNQILDELGIKEK